MGFDNAEHITSQCGPHFHGAVIAACDESSSARTKNHRIYRRLVCTFVIALLVFEMVGHDKLGGELNTSRQRRCLDVINNSLSSGPVRAHLLTPPSHASHVSTIFALKPLPDPGRLVTGIRISVQISLLGSAVTTRMPNFGASGPRVHLTPTGDLFPFILASLIS